jgi:uncharacterized protein
MGLPRVLKNFNLYDSGLSFLGQVEEIELPKIKMKGEGYRGAGMVGEVDLDMGVEKMEMTATYGGLVLEALRQFGATEIDATQLRFVGAYQDDSSGTVMQAEVVVRGRYSEIDLGTAKPGEAAKEKTTVTLTYYKLSVNGREEVEIDMVGGIYKTGGVDRYAAIRNAIGG